MINKDELCIVIPTFNRKDQLMLLLTQFKQQIEVVDFRIVVVVDGSTDGTQELLRTNFPDVTIINGNGNWWFTRSLNEGCKYAVEQLNAKFILTINDDVQIPVNYLKEILKNYQQCGINSIIGSCSYSMTKPTIISFSGFVYKSNRWKLKTHNHIKPYTKMEPGVLKGVAPSAALPTRGMFVPATVLQALNYLDEKHFPQYASDYDFVLRAAKNGVKVVVSYDAYVFENMEFTSEGNPRLTKSLSAFLKNAFLNKYSSNYFFKDIRMAWRHGIKVAFPFYFLRTCASIPYVYAKYKFIINKQLPEKK